MLIKLSIFVLCSLVVLKGVDSAELDKRAVNINDFRKQVLDSHNYYRKLHGCKELILNDTISAYAQMWANNISMGANLPHRPGNPYGENLFQAWWSLADYDINGDVAVDAWYAEKNKYVFGQEPNNSGDVAHFTQLVWKSSKQLGVGKVAKNGNVWVVANYDPRGNVKGKYVENVPPLV